MLAALLFPENLDWQATLVLFFLILLTCAVFLGIPLATLVYIARKILEYRRDIRPQSEEKDNQ